MRIPVYCNKLDTRQLSKYKWRLLSCFGFVTSRNEFIAVPVNRATNFASIPKWLRWIYRPGDFPSPAVIHDDLTNEFHEDWPRGTVFDFTQEAVKIFAKEIPKLDQHTFEAMANALKEYSFQVGSDRAHDIMTKECMVTKPSRHYGFRRFLVNRSLKVGGPKWTVKNP